MAYKEHGMWEVLEVLKHIHKGETVRSTKRQTGRERRTVERYVKTAEELGWVAGLHEPDEELAAEVRDRLKPGAKKQGPSASEALLIKHEQRISEWLKPPGPHARGLKLSKVHTLLTREGVKVSYSALHRFATARLGFGCKQTTVRMADVNAGELAEVDFGKMGLVHDAATGTRRMVHALIVTLVHSRHMYVYLTHSQKLRDLIAGLERAWAFFGGVTARVVLDNMKAAVVKADRYEPEFNRTFNEYAEHRGFAIDAAVKQSPKNKPHVERAVQYVRENFFRGESFLCLDHAQREALTWCLKTAGTRNHGTTHKQPLVAFEEHEKSALLPLIAEIFDTPTWATPKAHMDCHIQFCSALYSVPHVLCGKRLTVRANSKLVRIYNDGRVIATHPVQSVGRRSTNANHYPPEKTEYAMRDINHIIGKAHGLGDAAGRFTAELLAGACPWARIRQAQKLLRLADKYGSERVNDACARALGFDLINVQRVQRIIESALEREKPSARNNTRGITGTDSRGAQLPLRFLRAPGGFSQKPVANEAFTKES